MVGASDDPPLTSSIASDDGNMIDNSSKIISNGGVEEVVDELMVRIITNITTDDSNDNKNGANDDNASSSLMGAVTNDNNNNSRNVAASNVSGTSGDQPPPSSSASLEAANSEHKIILMTAANNTNNTDADDGHAQQQQQQQQEGEGGATDTKIIDDSSNNISCSDAITTTSAHQPAMAGGTSTSVMASDNSSASISKQNDIVNSDNSNLMTMKNSERDSQIIEILNHRRQLLNWVRTCRIQTQIVYNEMSSTCSNEEGEVSEVGIHERHTCRRRRRGLIINLSSSAAALHEWEGLYQPGEGVESEIAAYQSITSMSNRNPNSIKRPRPISSSFFNNENSSNNPRDLRRGPSVGKNSDATAPTSNSTPGGEVGPTTTTTTLHASSSTVKLSNMVHAQTLSSNVHNNHQGKQLHKFQPLQGGSTSASLLPNHASSSSSAAAANTAEKQKKSRKRKANNSNSNNKHNTNFPSTTLPFPPGGPPTHPAMLNNNSAALSSTTPRGGMMSSFSNNNLTSSSATTLVPSAAALNLLGLRDGLIAKLDCLLSVQKSKRQRCGGPTNRNETIPSRMVETVGGDKLSASSRHVDQSGANGVEVKMSDAARTGTECKPNNERDGNNSMPSMISEQKPSPIVSQLVSNGEVKFGTAPPKYSSLSEIVAGKPNELHAQFHHHPKPPLRLPIRRKTQWDCVLDEMKWAAADFHEERKWKIAVGQPLSVSVRKYKPKKKSSTSSFMGMTPTKFSQMSRGGSIVSSSSRSATMSLNSSSLGTGRSSIACNECDNFDPLYAHVSTEDVETVKIISRLLSVGVLDYWDSISSSRNEGESARYQRLHRLVELESLGNETVKIVKSIEIDAQFGDTRNKSRDDESLQSSNTSGAIRELRNDEISSRIESSLKLVNALKEQAAPSSSKTAFCDGRMGVELDQRQLHIVRFVERLWTSTSKSSGLNEGCSLSKQTEFTNDACSSISAIVGGSFGIGKTVAVCALLWRYRFGGPQIIVCSPGTVIRWMHELKKFDDLNCRIYSRDDSRAASSYKASDVVVCDYGSLCEVVDRDDRCLSSANNFASMILDLRHCGSSATWDERLSENEKHGLKTTQSPLDSVKWWVCLNNFIAKCPASMKRLVIEQSDHPRNRLIAPNGDDSFGSIGELEKRVHKLLAMKVAFVLHPSSFVSERGSVGKRVISWAKFEAKVKKPSNEAPSGGVGAAIDHVLRNGNRTLSSWGWSSVLTATLQRMRESLFDSMLACCENGSDTRAVRTNFSWELRICSLGKSQQAAYDKCFAKMRGNSDDAIACGLLELRKTCIHSTLNQIAASLLAPMRWHVLGDRIMRKKGSSMLTSSATISEPSIQLARKMMNKSSKMKELLRVLVTECGVDIVSGFELIETLLSNGDDDLVSVKKVAKKNAKVLILASLVEAQLFASSFLSAVGLHHEVLVSFDAKRCASSHPASESILFPSYTSSAESGYSWAWCQAVLSRFNDVSADRSIDIVISSPMTISSRIGGIGVANADFVISIDEDWSGREASHINSIFSKIYWSERRPSAEAASSEAKVPCKFIKLVSGNSCEFSFLCKGNKHNCLAGTVKSKSDSQKQCKKGTRRSSRQSTRTSKFNQDNPVASIENDSTMKDPTELCPIQVVPDAASISSDGFVVPPAKGGNGQTRTVEQHFIGSNVVRYRNCKLSSVFYDVSHSGSGTLFLPTKNGQDRDVGEVAFAWALFHAEDRACCHSTTFTGQLPGLNFGIQPIASSPTAAFLIDVIPVGRYVESFRRSTSFIPRERSGEHIHLRDERLVTGEGMASGRDSTSTFNTVASSIDLCRKTDPFDDNKAEHLVYSLPNDVSRKRKISAVDYASHDFPTIIDPYGEESAQSIFSFCYSVLNNSSLALEDGNVGSESLVYFPSFFRYLLQESQNNIMHVGPSGKFGVASENIADTPRFPSIPTVGSPPSPQVENHASSQLKICVGLPANNNLEFAFTIETNPHAFSRDQIKAGNEELSFHRRLLVADLQNATSHHGELSLNSMVLISQKKRPHHKICSNTPFAFAGPISDSSRKSSDGDGKKSIHKKLKRQQHICNTSSARDQYISYFHNERLLEQSCSARGKCTASNTMGRFQLHFRLNDLVSSSFSRHRRNIGPDLLGTIPLANNELNHMKNKFRSGIILPVGVKTPRMAISLSSSLGDSSEPWTRREDSILKGCVSRYGMNWQLAAFAVSSGMTCPFESIVGRSDTTKRSAAQCQSRWSSLKSDNSSVTTEMTERYSGAGSTSPIVRGIPLFVTKVEGMTRESIIFDRSLPHTGLEQQNGSAPLLGRSEPALGSKIAEEQNNHHLLARVEMLKKASLKRFVVNTPLLSSVPIHASHSEAIQAARASMLSAANGVAPPRHEMWPLELLDFRKQYNNESNQELHPAPASSQSPHRHQSSMPHHVPHTVHPTQPPLSREAGQIPPSHHQPVHAHRGPNSNVAYQSSQPRAHRHQH